MVQLDTTSFLCSGAQHRFYEPCILSKTVSSYFVICGAPVYAKMKTQKWIVIFLKRLWAATLKYILFYLSSFLVIVVLYSVISFTDRSLWLSGVSVHILLAKNFDVLQVQFCNRCNIAPALHQNGNSARQVFFMKRRIALAHQVHGASAAHACPYPFCV